MFADPQVIARGMRVALDGVPGVASPIVLSYYAHKHFSFGKAAA